MCSREGKTDRQTDTAAGRWAADLILAHSPSPCTCPSHLWLHWTSHPPQTHRRAQPCLFTAPPLPGWLLPHPAGKVFVTFQALAPQSPWSLLAQDALLEASCPCVLVPLPLAGVQTWTVMTRSAWGASPAGRSFSVPHAHRSGLSAPSTPRARHTRPASLGRKDVEPTEHLHRSSPRSLQGSIKGTASASTTSQRTTVTTTTAPSTSCVSAEGPSLPLWVERGPVVGSQLRGRKVGPVGVEGAGPRVLPSLPF